MRRLVLEGGKSDRFAMVVLVFQYLFNLWDSLKAIIVFSNGVALFVHMFIHGWASLLKLFGILHFMNLHDNLFPNEKEQFLDIHGESKVTYYIIKMPTQWLVK